MEEGDLFFLSLLSCSYTQLWHFHQRWRWDQGIYLPFFDFWRRRLVHNAPLPSFFFSFLLPPLLLLLIFFFASEKMTRPFCCLFPFSFINKFCFEKTCDYWQAGKRCEEVTALDMDVDLDRYV
jgi:hypothetical protein